MKKPRIVKTMVTIRLMDYGGFKIEHHMNVSNEMLADRLEMLVSSLRDASYHMQFEKIGQDQV